MKKIKSYIAVALIGITAFTFVGCNMIEKTPEAIQKTVIAKVGGEKITKADLDNLTRATLDGLKAQYGEDFENNVEIKDQLLSFRKEQLNNLVDEKVLYNKAEDLEVVPTEEELAKEIEEKIAFVKSLTTTEEEYLAAIKQYGCENEEAFKEFIKKQTIIGKVVDKMIEEVTVTDEEISTYYNENIDKYKKEAGANAYNILLGKDKYTEADAIEVRRKIVSGEATFEEMALKYNEDSTKTTGGKLGFVPYENSGMVEEFATAMKTLKEGEISQPVKSESYGWHIIKVDGITTEPSIAPLEEVKADIEKTLLDQKQIEVYNEKLEQYKKDMDVKLYESKL